MRLKIEELKRSCGSAGFSFAHTGSGEQVMLTWAERDVSSPSLEAVLSRAEGPSSCSCFAPRRERRPSQRRKGPELGLRSGSALGRFLDLQ